MRQHTNNQTEGLILTGTLTPRQYIRNKGMFLDLLSTETLPVNYRPKLGYEIPLVEDVVRNVCQSLQPPVGGRGSQLDTLSDDGSRCVVAVHVAEPYGGGSVLYGISLSGK